MASEIETLRSAVAQAVAATSVRAVAAQIDVSPPGLQHFLGGGQPFPRTREKLKRWYAAHQHDRDEALGAALSVVHELLPESARDEFARQMLRIVREHAPDAAEPVGAWLLMRR